MKVTPPRPETERPETEEKLQETPGKSPRTGLGPWSYGLLWVLAPWSVLALAAVAYDGLSGGRLSRAVTGFGAAAGAAGAGGPGGPAYGSRVFLAALLAVLAVWAVAVLLFLQPWRKDGRAALAASRPVPPALRPALLTGLAGNREPAAALAIAAFLLAGATLWGRGGRLYAPTIAGLWGLLAACACLYAVLSTRSPGPPGALWQPAPAAPERPAEVRSSAADFLAALARSDWYRGQLVWRRQVPARESRLSSAAAGAAPEPGVTGPAHGLYDNQARAWRLLDDGLCVLMASPLGSGKSTLAALYAASYVLTTARSVLCVCPDREAASRTGEAFARAAGREEWEWAVNVRILAGPEDAEEYLDDENRPVPDIAVVSAECLHLRILQQARRWESLLRNVGLVVLEDIHLYDLAPRQHAAYLFRRLWLALGRAASRPRVLVTAADSSDARRFARDLTGLDIKSTAVVSSDWRARPALEVVYWQPSAAGHGVSWPAPAAEPVPSAASAVSEACSLLASAVLHGFNAVLLTDERLLSPALARTVEADVRRSALQAAQSAYRRERQELAARIEEQTQNFIRRVNAARDKAVGAIQSQTTEIHADRRALLRRSAEETADALVSAAETVLAVAGGRLVRDRADAERDIRVFEELKRRLDSVFSGAGDWRRHFQEGGLPPLLQPLLEMKQEFDGLLSSTAVGGLVQALRVYAESMSRLEASRLEVCTTLERSAATYGEAASAAEAFDFVVIMGRADPWAVFNHQLAHLGQARREAPADAVVVILPSVEPVSHRLEHHPEDLFGPGPAAPLGLANPEVLKAHLKCALAECPLTEAEVHEVFGAGGLAALDELVSDGVAARVVVPAEDGSDARPAEGGGSDARPAEEGGGDEAADSEEAARLVLYSWNNPDRPPHPEVVFGITEGPGVGLRDPIRPARELARMTHLEAALKAYPGAILSAGGERYRVKEGPDRGLQLEERPWVTEPRLETAVDPPRTEGWLISLSPAHPIEVRAGRGRVRVRTVGFREFDGPDRNGAARRFHLGDLAPEASALTDLLHLSFLSSLRSSGEPSANLPPETAAGLAGLIERSLASVLEKASTLRVAATGCGCVVWDSCPGGSGAVTLAGQALLQVLDTAFQTLLDCRCLEGCPSCTGGRAGDRSDGAPADNKDDDGRDAPGDDQNGRDAPGPAAGKRPVKRELILLLGRALGREQEAQRVAAARYDSLKSIPGAASYVQALAREVAGLLDRRLGMHLDSLPSVGLDNGSGEADELLVPGHFREGDALAFLAFELALRWTRQPACFAAELEEKFGLSEGLALWATERVRQWLRLEPTWEPQTTPGARRGLAACRDLEVRLGLRAFVDSLAGPGRDVLGYLAG